MSDESSQRQGMAERIRTFDWAATALGPRDGWSQRLQLMVEQVLASPLIATLVCGSDRLLIYNDSAALLFGDRHPSALGRPLPSAFPAGWETVAPFYERAFAGEVVTVGSQPLHTRGEGAPTEMFDALLMPVREANGQVAHVHMTGFDITGRQRAEAALRDGEGRLRTMLESIAQATWETDAAGMVVADSSSWRAYTGQSLGQWLGYGWLDAIHEEDRAYAERQWHEAMTARRDVNAEFRLCSPEGGWRWTNVRAVPSLDNVGRVRKWMGMNIDIDARKEAERRQTLMLRLSDAMRSSADSEGLERDAVRVLAEALRADRVFLATIDLDGEGWCIRHAGADGEPPGWSRFPMTAFQRARRPQWEAGRMSSVADSETDPTLSPADRAAYADLGVRAAIGVPLVRNGRFAALLCVNHAAPRTWTEAELSLTGEAAERIWMAVERVRAEEALRESEQRQRLLLEGIPQLVWRAVDEGRWTWASPQWIAYTGLSNEASKDYGWLDALHPDDRPVARASWAQAPIDGIFQVKCRIWNSQSGLYQWFQTRGMPVDHSDSSVAEWLGTCTDIDEQVRAQEYLRQASIELEQRVTERTAELQQALNTLQREAREHEQAEERLRQSEKLKAVGQLTGGIAHDFNNMLQGITSALTLVHTRLGQGRVEDAQGYIEPAQKAATRAGALTHRLLAFSSQQTLSPRPVSLAHVARDMEDLVRRAVGPAVQVEVKSSDGPWQVLCDINQMESALLNLCINARDAMPEGGWLTISIEERMVSAVELAGFGDLSPGRFVMLSVTDTGTGMPAEVRARAFEPFFTTKPPGQGTGLGLSQIYGFIRQSGGLVQIETAPGNGTTVRLGLPAQEAAPEETRGAPKKGKTLLLVEDEHDLRRMLAVQLCDLGYGVLEADTADAALRVLNAGTHVDLLVTDVGLRGSRNGRQLAEAARAHISELPVIFVTGFPGDRVEGAGRVLQKPFKFSMLALLIQEQIG